MKEYFLIPSTHIKDVVKEKFLDKTNDIASEIPKDTILSLYDKISKLERLKSQEKGKIDNNIKTDNVDEDLNNHVIMEEGNSTINSNVMNNNKEIMEKPNILETNLSNDVKDKVINIEDIIKNAIVFTPKEYKTDAEELINIFFEKNLINVTENGYIPSHKVFLSDLIRAIFVKRAKVSHIEELLKEIIPKIPEKYIRNIKVKDLLGLIDKNLNITGGSHIFTSVEPYKKRLKKSWITV